MPLLDGCDNDTIQANIAKLIAEGYARPVAVAIALDHARKQGCELDDEESAD